MAEPDLLKSALSRLETTARTVALDSDALEILRLPKETLKARLVIRGDDGARRAYPAWRCRYDDSLGPSKGGIRFHPAVHAEEVESLAFWMTVKCAIAGLPYGGGKGGVAVDPASLSKGELERLSRAYVRAFAGIIGPDRDIPAPDVGTDATIMGWMADEYAIITGKPGLAAFTGKPLGQGGSAGREEATSLGGFRLLEHVAKRLDLAGGERVAVQGLGNVGLGMAQLLAGAGYKVVAVSDSKGALIDAAGLDIAQISKVKQGGGSVAGLAGAMAPDAVLTADCDILVPAALENAITADNAGTVTARIVLEMANGPTTPQADAILGQRGVTVIPDVLANSGGVIVSYFEWLQNRQGEVWGLEAVRTRLSQTLTAAADQVFDLAMEQKIDLRSAAYAHGLTRLCEAIRAQGVTTDPVSPE